MSKKRTSLWREAHLQVKKLKIPHVRSTVVARSTCPSQKCKKLTGTGHFWTLRCGFVCQAQGIKSEQKRQGFVAVSTTTTTILHYTTLHYTILHSTTTTLHYTTLHYKYNNKLHYTTLHYKPLHTLQLQHNYKHKYNYNYDYNYNYNYNCYYYY